MTKTTGEVGNTIVDNEDEGTGKTKALKDGAVMVTLTIDMKIKIKGEVEAKEKGSMVKIEEEVKIIFLEGDEDNGMVTILVTGTETIGTKIMTARIMGTEVGDGMAIEGKVIVIGDREEDGTRIPNIPNKITLSTPIRIIIGPLPWAGNINIKCPMTSTQPTHNRNSITHKDHLHNRVKQQIYVSCVKIKAIMTINANLQATSWPAHRKPSIKATRTITKIQIQGNGQMGKMITTTPMASLFSKGGSQCC